MAGDEFPQEMHLAEDTRKVPGRHEQRSGRSEPNHFLANLEAMCVKEKILKDIIRDLSCAELQLT